VLQAGRSRDRVPMRWIFFNWPNPSSCTMTLGLTQPLTEISTRNFPGGKWWPVHRTDNIPPSVSGLSRKCGNLNISTIWASTSCYRDTTVFLQNKSSDSATKSIAILTLYILYTVVPRYTSALE
jgi:hypothetical protein